MEANGVCSVPPSPRKVERELPDRLRCVAWRKTCACGHRFPRSALYTGKSKKTRKQGLPPACPQCGRERERCRKPRMFGTTVCRSHGGRGVIKKGFIPGLLALSDDEIQTLQEMMAEDDVSLRREFHLLRLLFGRAVEQFQQNSAAAEDNPYADAIGEMRRLAAIVDRLSSICERRVRVMVGVPKNQPEVIVRWEDPHLQHLIKEKLREMQDYTIRRTLAVVMLYLDPTAELGIANKLPASLRPFLPPPTKGDFGSPPPPEPVPQGD